MAGICTNAVRRSGAGCDHRDITVDLDGTVLVLDLGERDLDAMAWTDTEKKQLVLLGLKRLRAAGLSLDDIIGRVTNGDEGSSMRQWSVLSKDVTKTNIGTTYVNVLPGANGERALIDFTGATEFRIIVNMNAVGTGPWQLRLVRDNDDAILYEATNITGAGEKELDTNWQSLPAAASGLTAVRLQGKSSVAADDPVFRRCIVFTK